MGGRCRRACRLALIALAAALGVAGRPASAEAPGRLVLVYVEPNEGGASGGHAALAVAEDVYHYQVSRRAARAGQAPMRLVRNAWDDFRLRYADLGNRGLHWLDLDVPPENAQRAERFLRRRLAVERRRAEVVEALAFEHALARATAAGGDRRVVIPGAGLFRAPGDWPPDAALSALQERLASSPGAGSPRALLAEAEAALSRLPRRSARDVHAELAADRWPAAESLAGERWRDALAWRAALQVLVEARPLAPSGLLDAFDGRALAAAERRAIEVEQRELAERARQLLAASRPDRGFALLRVLARYAAGAHSLAQGRLLTLDPLVDDPQAPGLAIALSRDARRVATVAELAERARKQADEARRRVLEGASRPADGDWQRLAVASARAAATRGALATLRAGRARGELRLASERALPARPGAVWLPELSPTPEAELRAAAAAERRARRTWSEAQSYALLSRNCATELVTVLRETGAPGLAAADPAAGLGFIPRVLFGHADADLPTRARGSVPSTRARRLAAQRQREPGWWVALRESNVWTARSYPGSPRASHFLFFSDGTPWARPLVGALNLTYAGVQGAAGLVSWPWDGGERLERAGRGLLFSVPELFFLSLRRGHYEWTEALRARP